MTTKTEIIKVVDPYTDCVVTDHVSPKSLRKLIRKAKQNNPQAMNRLCRLFVTLLIEVYNNSLVKYILGEDAVNIVWEIFLSFIKSYRGNNFKHFPGLVKKQLLERIKNQLRKPGNYKYYVNPASDTLDAILKDDIYLKKVVDNAGFYALLEGCTKKQIKIAEMIYMYDLDKSYIAKVLHMNRVNIQKADAKIIKKARLNYYKQKRHDAHNLR